MAMTAKALEGRAAVAEIFTEALAAVVKSIVPGASGIHGLRRLSAGATLETWSLDAVCEDSLLHSLILRRAPGGGGPRGAETLPLELEADLLRSLASSNVPVPRILHTLRPSDLLGAGFFMTRIDGETIPRKILRDPYFSEIRPQLTKQFATVLSAIHQVDVAELPTLPVRGASVMIERWEQRYQSFGVPRPVFELAFRWLRENAPPEPARCSLVHGDFRNGNMIVDRGGVRAVLDWEIAHIGDPAEDLAWISLPPWRFGELDNPVGGLGSREEFFDRYGRETGQTVEPLRVHYWEVLGSLRWGMACAGMLEWFASGRDPSVERAMIARRVSENELDLMRILKGKA
jgi:aminoglycoside phosphotransferase (APT) family kinase protein